jgi:flagellar protein FliS
MVNADKNYTDQRKATMFSPVSARSANAYQRVGVETEVPQADPHRLVMMLFDGLSSNIVAARGALARGDIKTKCQHVGVAVRILEEGLKGTLNLAEGGEIAQNLERLYDFCVLRLTQANARNDDAIFKEVIEVLTPIADGWRQIGVAATTQSNVL